MAGVDGKECLFCKAVVPANTCVVIKECSRMPHSFACPVFVNGDGSLTASYVDWNKSGTIPNWVRYKLFLYEAVGVG
jgi:hypothetical protein